MWPFTKVRKKAFDADDALSVIIQQMFGTGAKITSFSRAITDSPWVSRAVRILSQTCADVPWTVTVNGKADEGAVRKIEQTSSILTFTELLEKTIAWQALHGFAVWYAELGRITLIDADQVRVKQGTNGDLIYDFQRPVNLPRENLVTLPNWNYQNTPTGLADITSCIDAVNLEESAIELMNNILANGGLLSGILGTDQDLSENEVQAIKDAFREKYGGHANSGAIGVFGRGLTWQKIGVSPNDFSALDVSKITRQMIASAFGVPAIYLMDTESVDYANSKTQERMFYQTSVQPRCNRLADRITRFVLPLLGIRGAFGWDWSKVDALQEDKLQRAQIDQLRLASSVVSINEIRARDGLDPVNGGDAPLVSAMLVPLGAIRVEDVSKSSGLTPTATKSFHTPEARQVIGKAFLARLGPEESKFARETVKVFNKQSKRIIAWVENGKSIEGETKAAIPAEILDDEELLDVWRPLFLAFGMAASEATAERYRWVKIDPSVVRRWIASRGARYSKLVNETTNADIMDILAADRANGLSIADMIEHIKGYFGEGGVARSRAETVARTQVVAVNNYADIETYRENGVEKKEWLSTNDDRVRDSHAAMDGQVVSIDEPFVTGNGAYLQYPGDPDGPPEEIINCRCTELPVV